MKAMVVYESMFGATHEVAAAVAEGLRARFDVVDVVPVAGADSARTVEVDLLVVGGPTHAHGMSRPSTRQAAVEHPDKYAPAQQVELGADGIGVREWLEGLPFTKGFAAAFDTRGDAPAMLTGRASSRISHRLRRAGRTIVVPAESFVVAKGGALRFGEHDRAVAWGRTVAAVASSELAGHAV